MATESLSAATAVGGTGDLMKPSYFARLIESTQPLARPGLVQGRMSPLESVVEEVVEMVESVPFELPLSSHFVPENEIPTSITKKNESIDIASFPEKVTEELVPKIEGSLFQQGMRTSFLETPLPLSSHEAFSANAAPGKKMIVIETQTANEATVFLEPQILRADYKTAVATAEKLTVDSLEFTKNRTSNSVSVEAKEFVSKVLQADSEGLHFTRAPQDLESSKSATSRDFDVGSYSDLIFDSPKHFQKSELPSSDRSKVALEEEVPVVDIKKEGITSHASSPDWHSRPVHFLKPEVLESPAQRWRGWRGFIGFGRPGKLRPQ